MSPVHRTLPLIAVLAAATLAIAVTPRSTAAPAAVHSPLPATEHSPLPAADTESRHAPIASGSLLDRGGTAPNQPYSSFWFPNDLLTWTPASDPDAAYNRGGVPIRQRFTNPGTQVNTHARDNEARVAALSVMFPSTSNNPSQGSDAFNVFAFNYWQYIDILVMWGGSAGEGLILSPSADVIDAAHRNGVQVLGTIFFPPTAFGGQIQWVWDLVQQDGATFPIADKLIEIADHYGFDGWFLNQETAGGNATLAQQMQDFLRYFQDNKSPGMHMMWYDAMISSGAIVWQNELNGLNDMFLEDGGRISDSMFLNFWWNGTTNLADSRAHAIGLGRDPYDVYAGVNVQPNGTNTGVGWPLLSPEGNAHTVSLGFFGTEWPYTSSTSQADFYQRANRFWVGANRDPANTTTGSAWKGVAHYVPAKSPITEPFFVTNFNGGQGHLYAIDGDVLRDADWNNRSLQDVMPTWRWLAETTGGTALVPDIDFSDAYYGGSSLVVNGDLGPFNTTHLKLFKTAIDVSAGTSAGVVYKTGAVDEDPHMRLGLAFDDSPETFEYLDLATTTSGWTTATVDLGAFAGRTIAAISLLFESTASVPGYSIHVGRIGIFDGAVDVPVSPTNTQIDDLVMLDARHVAIRLKWDHSADPVYAYNVYQVNPDASRTFLGGTPNNALFIPSVERIEAEVTTVLEVQPVSHEFGHGAADTTSVYWGPDPPNDVPDTNANGPYCGVASVPLQLKSTGTHDPDGTVEGYLWDFGDGATSSDADPMHTYAAAGTYTVVLTATDDLGASASDTTQALIADAAQGIDPNVAWYEFETGTGNTAFDTSGNGNNGVIIGATWTDGIIGGALDFDGAGDYVRVADYPRPTSTMTVTLWANAESRPGWASMVKNWAGPPGAFHLGLRDNDGDLDVQVGEADGEVVFVREGASNPFPLDTWVHVAVVADGELVRLYRDGSEVGSIPYDGTLNTTRPGLGIGVKLNDSGTGPNPVVAGYWNGRLDDVRIYDRALCQNEVEALYLLGTTTAVDNDPLASAPLAFQLTQNAPNPFNPVTQIRYALPERQHVSLTIYDTQGRQIVELVRGPQDAGAYAVEWRGRDATGRPLPSGAYFYRLVAGELRAVRKMMLVK